MQTHKNFYNFQQNGNAVMTPTSMTTASIGGDRLVGIVPNLVVGGGGSTTTTGNIINVANSNLNSISNSGGINSMHINMQHNSNLNSISNSGGGVMMNEGVRMSSVAGSNATTGTAADSTYRTFQELLNEAQPNLRLLKTKKISTRGGGTSNNTPSHITGNNNCINNTLPNGNTSMNGLNNSFNNNVSQTTNLAGQLVGSNIAAGSTMNIAGSMSATTNLTSNLSGSPMKYSNADNIRRILANRKNSFNGTPTSVYSSMSGNLGPMSGNHTPNSYHGRGDFNNKSNNNDQLPLFSSDPLSIPPEISNGFNNGGTVSGRNTHRENGIQNVQEGNRMQNGHEGNRMQNGHEGNRMQNGYEGNRMQNGNGNPQQNHPKMQPHQSKNAARINRILTKKRSVEKKDHFPLTPEDKVNSNSWRDIHGYPHPKRGIHDGIYEGDRPNGQETLLPPELDDNRINPPNNPPTSDGKNQAQRNSNRSNGWQSNPQSEGTNGRQNNAQTSETSNIKGRQSNGTNGRQTNNNGRNATDSRNNYCEDIYELNDEPNEQLNEHDMMKFEDDESAEIASNVETQKCPTCNRNFNLVSFPKHVKVCKEVFVKKRKQFNVQKQRLTEEEIQASKAKEEELKNNKQYQEKLRQAEKRKNRWKQKSLDFRNAIRNARLLAKQESEIISMKEGTNNYSSLTNTSHTTNNSHVSSSQNRTGSLNRTTGSLLNRTGSLNSSANRNSCNMKRTGSSGEGGTSSTKQESGDVITDGMRGIIGDSILGPPMGQSSSWQPEEIDDGRVPCPHCNRRFEEGVAERHIPKCAETKARPNRLIKGSRNPSTLNKTGTLNKIGITGLLNSSTNFASCSRDNMSGGGIGSNNFPNNSGGLKNSRNLMGGLGNKTTPLPRRK